MDFDEFEKEQEQKEKEKKEQLPPTYTDRFPFANNGNGIIDQFEEWEMFMQDGFASRVQRDYFGFRRQ